MAHLLADDGLKKLRELFLGIRVPISSVIACPHLTNLRTLGINVTALTDEGAEAFLASPTFANLETLFLLLPTRPAPKTLKKLSKRFGPNLVILAQD
ncbi:hypothetical protein [Frigoriglobus tundricola]|uniref:Uncharacterized protein n=1 Tax=Frigoriglobus tundricola TaxID=2774151 RepID=A0A6M5Z4I9_9BACT|nr:hypothetical protein [Frigoriglobus tundricola]QJX00384.1 hypothetical protein FTUN_8013 [Frigoriglobus tundricola]